MKKTLASPSTNRPVALTIAGSDSAGCAGIQVDLRTFAKSGVFGTSVVAAVTAQTPSAVKHILPISYESVKAQMSAVLEGFPVAAVKTGMLWSKEVVELIGCHASSPAFPPLVVDPVMTSTSGRALIESEVSGALEAHLFPQATLITPNLDEASAILGYTIGDSHTMERAAEELHQRFGCAVLLKGGHIAWGDPLEILVCGSGRHRWSHRWVSGVTPRGTGCMLSASITAQLAKGKPLAEACGVAIRFVEGALSHPLKIEGLDLTLPGIEGDTSLSE